MTDERAKEIAEELRKGASLNYLELYATEFLLYLYDQVQALKAQQAGLSFMSAGIQPVRKVDG